MRFLTFSVFAALLSAPAFAADVGTYRPGTPYSSTVATGADVCDNQCAGDAQCRGWNYVKPNPRAAGICEFLSSVSTPIASQISISGENHAAAPYYAGLTAGRTNTVRVGEPVVANPVRVGEAPLNRRVVRQAPPKRIQTQQTSTQSVQDMSLTAQQNRYRRGLAPTPQTAQSKQAQRPAPNGRPMFRPILDAPTQQVPGQQMQAPQPRQLHPRQAQTHQSQARTPQNRSSRRATGPRRAPAQAASQFQNPPFQPSRPPFSQQTGQPYPPQAAAQQMAPRGDSRPPIGQPIASPRAPAGPQRSTPSQRLAQFASQTPAPVIFPASTGPMALDPQQARQSLFGKLNDDVAMPSANAVPTKPVAEGPLEDILAGGH